MSNASTRARLSDLALVTFLAPLVEGRRVAVVGPTSGEVARRARHLGASVVISFGGVGDDIAVRALTPGALAGMHGKLDVVIVPDAGAVPSLVAVLDESRRALGSQGVVVVASEPEDGAPTLEHGGRKGPGYYDLEELCGARFARVRMVGRGPFVGYTLAPLDAEAEEVSLDTRLIDGDPPKPEAYVAVASDSDVALDALTVVQVPGEVLHDVRAAASKGLEDELTKRDQKLKEVEAASAERWVKIQRYEHGLKELEEENRKARDRAVKLSKELEDERKLRQRVELDAQMNRRAPELPKTPDLAPELERARAEVARLEKELAAARDAEAAARQESVGAHARVVGMEKVHAETAARVGELERDLAARADHVAGLEKQLAAKVNRVRDLERELDETQSAEADLRAQLDEALERDAESDARNARVTALEGELAAARAELETLRSGAVVDGEYARLEQCLAERAEVLARVTAERERAEQAVRELTFTLAESDKARGVDELGEMRSRMAAMAAVHAALVDRVDAVTAECEALRVRAKTAAEAAARVVELEAALEAAKAAAATAAAATESTATAPAEDGARVSELAAAVEAQREAAHEARNEVSRLYALNVGMEARLVHTSMELEGARAGYARRVAELEREVDRLVRALEVVATQTEFDRAAAQDALRHELEAARAERDGLAWRLREAEDAVTSLSARGPSSQELALREERDALVARATELEASLEAQRAKSREEGDTLLLATGASKMDQLMADLAATAERLAQTEDAKAAAEEAKAAAEEARAAAEAGKAAAELAASAAERSAARAEDELARVSVDLASSRAGEARLATDLATARAELTSARADVARVESELASVRGELARVESELSALRAAPAPAADSAELEGLRAKAAELTSDRDRRAADVESLLTQLTDRDLRLSSLERRREEEIAGVQRSLTMETQANRALRTTLEDVRAQLSAILVDGRGAMVAHDLMALLRRIEQT